MASAGLVPGRYVSFLNQPWPASCKVGPDPLPDFAKFRISTNGPNATFLGSVCSTIYSFGDFPMYLGMGPGGACADGDWNCTKAHAVFGGLPQLTNLTKHLAKVQADIEQLFPDPEWDGVANVDWEAWKPIYKANRYNEYWPVNILRNTFSDRARCIAQLRPGSSFLLSAPRFLDRIYINRSLTLAEQQHPTYTRAQIEATAEKDYNAAAQNFWLSSLRLAKKLRPKGTWGCPSDFCRTLLPVADRTPRCIEQLRPGSSFLLSAPQFFDRVQLSGKRAVGGPGNDVAVGRGHGPVPIHLFAECCERHVQ